MRLKKMETLSDLDSFRQSLLDKLGEAKSIIHVCCSTGCRAGGALKIIDEIGRAHV